MELLAALLNSGPATLVIVVAVLVFLHKTGTLQLLLDFLKKTPSEQKQGGGGSVADQLLGLSEQMSTLSAHYNHDTTELLTQIRDGINKLTLIHENYETIGIKTRDCAKRP